jgi:hypothetical protein
MSRLRKLPWQLMKNAGTPLEEQKPTWKMEEDNLPPEQAKLEENEE